MSDNDLPPGTYMGSRAALLQVDNTIFFSAFLHCSVAGQGNGHYPAFFVTFCCMASNSETGPLPFACSTRRVDGTG